MRPGGKYSLFFLEGGEGSSPKATSLHGAARGAVAALVAMEGGVGCWGGGGAASSAIVFHAESVKVPLNCTLTSASELEAALPEELLPISALGERIHHWRPREAAKSFPEPPPAAVLLALLLLCLLFFLPFLSSFFPPSEGRVVLRVVGAAGRCSCHLLRHPGASPILVSPLSQCPHHPRVPHADVHHPGVPSISTFPVLPSPSSQCPHHLGVPHLGIPTLMSPLISVSPIILVSLPISMSPSSQCPHHPSAPHLSIPTLVSLSHCLFSQCPPHIDVPIIPVSPHLSIPIPVSPSFWCPLSTS